MPRRGRSGVKNLYKKHSAICRNRDPLKCDCPWYAKYKHVNVNLANWSGQYVDPRRRQHAVVVLNRLRTAVDEHFFRPDGDYDVLGGKQTLRSFINEWKEHYAKGHDLDFASLTSMLRAIDREFGSYTLEYLENASLQIERWLNELGRERRWADNTWNRYYQMFNSLFVRAIKWKNGTVVRMKVNPMASIERRTGSKRRFRVRLEEGIEDRLFAACDRLDDVPPTPWAKLDWNKAEEIRRRAAAGESQLAIAADFKISPSLCCEVIAGVVWNLIPFAGGAIASILGDFASSRRISTICEGLAALNTGLQRHGTSAERYLSREQLVDLVHDTLLSAASASDAGKVKALTTALIHSLVSPESFERKQLLLQILRETTTVELIVLRVLYEAPDPFVVGRGGPPRTAENASPKHPHIPKGFWHAEGLTDGKAGQTY